MEEARSLSGEVVVEEEEEEEASVEGMHPSSPATMSVFLFVGITDFV